MSTPTARPPILRFLILFCGLLAGALALAALSSSPADGPPAEAAPGAAQAAR